MTANSIEISSKVSWRREESVNQIYEFLVVHFHSNICIHSLKLQMRPNQGRQWRLESNANTAGCPGDRSSKFYDDYTSNQIQSRAKPCVNTQTNELITIIITIIFFVLLLLKNSNAIGRISRASKSHCSVDGGWKNSEPTHRQWPKQMKSETMIRRTKSQHGIQSNLMVRQASKHN